MIGPVNVFALVYQLSRKVEEVLAKQSVILANQKTQIDLLFALQNSEADLKARVMSIQDAVTGRTLLLKIGPPQQQPISAPPSGVEPTI
jgi:hypothetical protein